MLGPTTCPVPSALPTSNAEAAVWLAGFPDEMIIHNRNNPWTPGAWRISEPSGSAWVGCQREWLG
jgi:hypothetical protein